MAEPAAEKPSSIMSALVAVLLAGLLVLGVAPVALLAAAIVLAVIVGLAGYALHQVGGLDLIVFGVASVTAIALLATAIGAAFVGRLVNRSPTSTLGKALGLVCRMPFLSMSIALVPITLIALKLAWKGQSLTAAMIILVDLHFYGVAAVVLGAALLIYATMAVYRWSTLTRYRAGIATGGMLALLIPLTLVNAIGRALSAPPSPIADPAWTHATSALEAERELLVDFDDLIEDRTSPPSLSAVAPAPTNSIRPVSKALIDECFDKLSRDEEQRVRATVQRDNRTLSPDDVADLVRDAMIKVCLAQGERPVDNLGAVLTTAARNQATDYHRKLRTACAADDKLPSCPPRWRDEDERIVSKVDVLNHAWCKLDAATQNIIVLHYLEGMTFSEIGRLLAISESEAKDTANNGIKKMRTILVEKCEP